LITSACLASSDSSPDRNGRLIGLLLRTHSVSCPSTNKQQQVATLTVAITRIVAVAEAGALKMTDMKSMDMKM